MRDETEVTGLNDDRGSGAHQRAGRAERGPPCHSAQSGICGHRDSLYKALCGVSCYGSVSLVQQAVEFDLKLHDGYAPFCKHLFVPNFVGAKVDGRGR
jgi:hypothetical protein